MFLRHLLLLFLFSWTESLPTPVQEKSSGRINGYTLSPYYQTTTIDYDLADFDEFGVDPVAPDIVNIADTKASGMDSGIDYPSDFGGHTPVTGPTYTRLQGNFASMKPSAANYEDENKQSEGGPSDEGTNKDRGNSKGTEHSNSRNSGQTDHNTEDDPRQPAVKDANIPNKSRVSSNKNSSNVKETPSSTVKQGNGDNSANASDGSNHSSVTSTPNDSKKRVNSSKHINTAANNTNEITESGTASRSVEKSSLSSTADTETENSASEFETHPATNGALDDNSSASNGSSESSSESTSIESSMSSSSESTSIESSMHSSSESTGSRSDSDNSYSIGTSGQVMNSAENSNSNENRNAPANGTYNLSDDNASNSAMDSQAWHSAPASTEYERNTHKTKRTKPLQTMGSTTSLENDGSVSNYDKSVSIDSSEFKRKPGSLDKCFNKLQDESDICILARSLKLICMTQFPGKCVTAVDSKKNSPSGNAGISESSESDSNSLDSYDMMESPGESYLDSSNGKGTTGGSEYKIHSDESSSKDTFSSESTDLSLDESDIESLSASFEQTNNIGDILNLIKETCPGLCSYKNTSTALYDDNSSEGEVEDKETDDREESADYVNTNIGGNSHGTSADEYGGITDKDMSSIDNDNTDVSVESVDLDDSMDQSDSVSLAMDNSTEGSIGAVDAKSTTNISEISRNGGYAGRDTGSLEVSAESHGSATYESHVSGGDSS